MSDTIDWPPRGNPRRRLRVILIAVLAALFLGGGTALSFYVDALWFDSLGYADVFWKTLSFQGRVFGVFALATFGVLYTTFVVLKPERLGELPVLVNGRPLTLPVEPVLRLAAVALSLVVGALTGAAMMGQWPTFALYWHAPAAAGTPDPIFGRPLEFYLFALPAAQLVSGWLLSMTVIACGISVFFLVVGGGQRALIRQRGADLNAWRGLSLLFAALLVAMAWRVYLGRFELLFIDHTIFSGVTYTDAHVALTGQLVVAVALLVGAAVALLNAVGTPRVAWLAAAVVPAAVCYAAVGVIGWYVTSFVVKPNELVRESPFITHNIRATREAFGLGGITEQAFPAEGGVKAVDPARNQATLSNIRLWDWRALQDTLRQIQEIRTYYDFPDIDIDRYEIDGTVRQMMLAVRELNVDRLPESSRNWINEKLIYTHGYGITMNTVNGFTPEGLPELVLSNMPVQSTIPSLSVTRPEIYFGELANTDVYVKTRQKEFNYPQGETNNLTSYEGTGGIVLGSFARRLLVALDRGDLAKLPFSDDITPESRLLMRRNVNERLATIAPFLRFDPDPYIVIGDEGRLFWIVDGFTASETYPYSRHYRFGRDRVNYLRNSVKAVIDAYNGTTTLYVFDAADPVVQAYRAVFPSLFRDAAAMPATLRAHVRYPELLLKMQAAVYGLYHMTNPDVFYNREDLWTVASEGTGQAGQGAVPMEPNYVLMTLPGQQQTEFIGILPFTPANRNNLIGWIAGRSDGEHYGTAVVFDFPKTRLVDGPLQVEARIDQNPQLSGQLSLWNQQGSHVRRGSLLVIPIGRALLYAEPIYLQAERSPMPQLRLVVLALQDQLAYGPTFEAALASLFGSQPATSAPPTLSAPTPLSPTGSPGQAPLEVDAAIAEAARALTDYQRLTAEGKLGEAGQKLEELKKRLEDLQRRRR